MRLVLDPLPEADRLASLLEAQRSYLGHDLANQLVGIQGFARLLAEGGLTDGEGRDIARQLADLARLADQRARRLAQVGQLLAEHAGPPLSLLDAAREAAEDARIAYHVQGTDSLVPVSPRLLHAVLSLLLANARPSGQALVEIGEGVLSLSAASGQLLDPSDAPGFLLVRQAASLWSASVMAEGSRVEIRFPIANPEA